MLLKNDKRTIEAQTKKYGIQGDQVKRLDSLAFGQRINVVAEGVN